MEKRDLIAAIATAAGNAAVGVIRISGQDLSRLFPALLRGTVRPRKASLAEFLDENGEAIDLGLALYFPAPHSYTGEDVLELQGHGGSAVMNTVLRRCLALGARLAEPGEFTLRAYLNGKLDLAEAEAVADLISAKTERAARSATRSLRGDFSTQVERLISEITALRLEVEAAIDFSEEDLGPVLSDGLVHRVAEVRRQVGLTETAAARGSVLQEGARVVLYGPPNVGKSSLMNRFAGHEVSIVTEIPGTTRDAIRQTVSVHGVPIVFVDTAGMREAEDAVERIGIERTRVALVDADLALVMFDARTGPDPAVDVSSIEGRILYVGNKADLCEALPSLSVDVVYVSAKTGQGLNELSAALLARLGWDDEEGLVYAARARHVDALKRAGHFLEAVTGAETLDQAAEELRCAQSALREVGGEISSDELLGEIFSRFCIGK